MDPARWRWHKTINKISTYVYLWLGSLCYPKGAKNSIVTRWDTNWHCTCMCHTEHTSQVPASVQFVVAAASPFHYRWQQTHHPCNCRWISCPCTFCTCSHKLFHPPHHHTYSKPLTCTCYVLSLHTHPPTYPHTSSPTHQSCIYFLEHFVYLHEKD